MSVQRFDGKKRNNSIETEYVESFERIRRKNIFRRIKRTVLYVFLMFLLICTFAAAVAAVFFRVKTVTVKGDGNYQEQEIIDAGNIEIGTNLFLLDSTEIEKRLLDAFPLLYSVNIKKSIPSSVQINVKFDKPTYYTVIGNEYFLISNELRVLGKYTYSEDMISQYPDIKKLYTSPVKRAVVGETITFKSDTYSEALVSLLSFLSDSEVFSGITCVDASNKFDICLYYDHRLKAMMGSVTDMNVKLMFLNGIVNDLGQSSGTIDITDAEVGYVLLSSNAVFE